MDGGDSFQFAGSAGGGGAGSLGSRFTTPAPYAAGSNYTPGALKHTVQHFPIDANAELTGVRFRAGSAFSNRIMFTLYDVDGEFVAKATSPVGGTINIQHDVPFDGGPVEVTAGVYYLGALTEATVGLFSAPTLNPTSQTTEASFVAPASIVIPTAGAMNATPSFVAAPILQTY